MHLSRWRGFEHTCCCKEERIVGSEPKRVVVISVNAHAEGLAGVWRQEVGRVQRMQAKNKFYISISANRNRGGARSRAVYEPDKQVCELVELF